MCTILILFNFLQNLQLFYYIPFIMMNLTINTVLKEEVSKLGYNFFPADLQASLSQKRLVQEYLTNVVNCIGEKSTLAQGLSKTVTSMDKLRNTEHILYLLKDAAGNNGQGEVIGMLKIGVKNLYLYDASMTCHKVSPLCILDFYILEEYQKRGFGKKLFDYVLADQNTTVDQLAIDNPSQKFENFLQKHFNTGKLFRQPNCFAVSATFFENVQSINNFTHGRPSTSTVAAVGRYTAHKPPSSIQMVIHGAQDTRNGEKKTKANQSSSIKDPETTSNDVTSYGTTSVDLKKSHNKLW